MKKHPTRTLKTSEAESGPIRAAAFVLILLTALAHIVWMSFICDDAFISFRYAQNLINGHGLVFNIGEKVEGYTNFLWVLLSALILKIGAKPEVWTLWIGGSCAMATVGALAWYLRRRVKEQFFAGVLLAANGGFAAWATGGLETAQFTALIFGAYLSIAATIEGSSHKRGGYDDRRILYSAVFLLLASLTRPEGVLFALLVGLFFATKVLRDQMRWQTLGRWAAIWLVPYVTYFVWRWQYYGHLFPNTFYVKASGLWMITQGVVYILYACLRFHLYLLFLPGVVLLILRRSWSMHRDVAWLSATFVIPYLGYVCMVGGDFMDMFRFLVPVLPVVMLVVGASWSAFHTLISHRSPALAGVIVAILLILCIGLNIYTSWDSQQIWNRRDLDSIGLLRRYVVEWTRIAHYQRGISHPTDTIAITAAGIIPYYSGLYTLDQLGLVAADLSQYRRVNARPGHTMLVSGDYLFRVKPQFILGHPNLTDDPAKARISHFVEDQWLEEMNREYMVEAARISTVPPLYIRMGIRRDVAARATIIKK